LVVEAPHLPVPGETVLGGPFRTGGGGKGANQAVAAARLGARVSLIGCVGQDAFGRQLRALLRADGIDVRSVRRVDPRVNVGEAPTGVALIVVRPGGDNVIVVAPGANACLSPMDVAAAQPRLVRASVVVSQLEVPLETVIAGAAAVHQRGVPFILNAAPAQALSGDLLRRVDALVVNETELGVVANQTVSQGKEAAAARAVLNAGPRAVVVTLGARGALVVDAHAATSIPAFRIEAVDTTAAGDAFVGALAARYRGPDSLLDAARYASAAGAIACTRRGAQPSLPRACEVERLLGRGASGSRLMGAP
jgi:ribokinase